MENETFFSWLHRQSIFNEAFDYPLYLLLDDFERYSRLESFDRDFDFTSRFAKESLSRLSLSFDECSASFGSFEWLLPQYNRRAFCWECLQEHVEKVRYPCYLMSWCSVVRTHCNTHFSLLREYPRVDRVSLNPALGAFVYFCENKDQYDRDELHRFFSSTPIANYCLRMAAHMEMDNQPSKAECSPRWGMHKILLQIMLFPAYGVVNTILQRNRTVPRTSNVWQALAYAPICASSIDRALALLLVGIATRFFRDSEISEIISILERSQYLDVRFYDQQTLGSACSVFTYETTSVISQALHHACQNRPSAAVEKFLAGFMDRPRRR